VRDCKAAYPSFPTVFRTDLYVSERRLVEKDLMNSKSGAIMPVEKEILFTPDIAKMFETSENTLRRSSWRKKIRIPLRKVGKRLCASRVEIENWFKGIKIDG